MVACPFTGISHLASCSLVSFFGGGCDFLSARRLCKLTCGLATTGHSCCSNKSATHLLLSMAWQFSSRMQPLIKFESRRVSRRGRKGLSAGGAATKIDLTAKNTKIRIREFLSSSPLPLHCKLRMPAIPRVERQLGE
jgi:hypothetical protein